MNIMLTQNAWLVFGLITAFAVATQDATVKKFFSHLSHYEMTSYPTIYSLPFLIITACFMDVPDLDRAFYIYFFISIPLNAFCFLMYNKAIKISPLSLTVPYLAFTPTFIIVTGYLFLNETLNSWGILGIVTTCVGSYILNIDPLHKDIWRPFKAIFREKGSLLMFTVSFLFAFAIVLGKGAILHSSPLFFSVSFFIALNIFLLLFLYAAGKIRFQRFLIHPLKGLLSGGLYFIHVICHGYAISLAKAAYMISVKRLSILLSIIYGGIIFKEKNLFIRFAGALFMLSGAVMIMIKGR